MKIQNGVLQRLFITALLALFMALSSGQANSAQAHRLHVFAWLENDKIIVECNFGNNRPAIDAPVAIVDKDTNRLLLQGATDRTGHFDFAVPSVVRDGHTLGIVVNTGDGHRSEWIMPASELYAASSLTAGFDQEAINLQKDGQGAASTQQPAAPEKPASALPRATAPLPANQMPPQYSRDVQPVKIPGPEHLRVIIRDEMEQQLAPVRKALAAKSAEGPTITEVIGGLGWIVGLVGIVLFFLSRRKNQA